jgi:hypothetical protein
MSRLTVTEKQHWKDRIERRLDRAIEVLEAQDPSLMTTVTDAAELAAHKALGTAELHSRIEAIKQQSAALEAEHKQLEAAMYRQGLGKVDPSPASGWQVSGEFWNLHRKVKAGSAEQLLRDTPLGREILKLRAEKEAVLDTVWLATSSSEIRNLWGRVSAVLGEDATPLQQQILTQDSVANAAA